MRNSRKLPLETAINLDPRLGNACLQLGILRWQRGDDAGAIIAFQNAVETTPLPEAHYRLAAIYRPAGIRRAAEATVFVTVSDQP